MQDQGACSETFHAAQAAQCSDNSAETVIPPSCYLLLLPVPH